MSSKDGSGAGIGVLKGLVVFAIVAACVGLGFVILHKDRDAAPDNATQKPSAPAQNQDSTSPVATPSTRPETPAPSQATVTAIVPHKATGTTVTTKTAPRTKSPIDTAGQPKPTATETAAEQPTDAKAAREAKREAARAKYLASLKVGPAPSFEPMTWDNDTGELVVGNQRFLSKLVTLRQLDLSRTERKNLEHLAKILRPRIDTQLAMVQQEIKEAVEAYNDAVSRGDKEEMANYSHMVHHHLIPHRDGILKTVDVQLDEILEKALPGR